jgi:Winged helix DNA-binding domain
VTGAAIRVTRAQVVAFRRRTNALDERLPLARASLRTAAWAGLQDSMPRAALLSIHARVERTPSTVLDDASLVQIWGPRYNVFVVAGRDVAPFTLGVYPDDARGRDKAEDLAARLDAFLGGRTMSYGEAGVAMGMHPNNLRYASPTGTLRIRWEGARAPTIRTVPRPGVRPEDARLELARRFLRVYGPSAPESFSRWAGIGPRFAAAAFDALRRSLAPVRTPIGDGWILARDEPNLRAGPSTPAPARLLPSGDAFFLLWGRDRDLLVADPGRRDALWTPRVWPGALLVAGEIAGTWRRANEIVTVEPWRRLSRRDRRAVEDEAIGLPLAGIEGSIAVRWSD